MILSDRDIKQALNSGDLVIEPLEDEAAQIQPASVDLRLGDEFVGFQDLEFDEGYFDLGFSRADDYCTRLPLNETEGFVILPGEFVLGTTIEIVKLPDYLVGRVDGRSSIGRMGILIHATAGFIDPGFEGKITLEISNIGIFPVMLRPGMRFCQISFEQLTTRAERPYGTGRGSKYQGQTGVTPSRIHSDA